MINYYQRYGTCYLIRVKKSKMSIIDVLLKCSESKYKSFIGQSDYWIYVILVNTFVRPAYDLYYEILGNDIYKLDGLSAGVLLEMLEDIESPLIIHSS